MRRTPLARRTPLKTLTPLARSAAGLARKAMAKKPSDTRPERSTIELVFCRDGARCVVQRACNGRDLAALVANHRVNRGMGGSSAPWINQPQNLIVCCWDDNSWLEDHPTEAYDCGWKVRHGADLDAAPVLYPDGFWYVLDADGGRARWMGWSE